MLFVRCVSVRLLRTCSGRVQFTVCSTFKASAAERVLQKTEHDECDLQQDIFTDPTALFPYAPVMVTAGRQHHAVGTTVRGRAAA